MAIQKNITIDGIEVSFKASAAVPRLYRLKFRRDIYKDFASLKTEVNEGDKNKSEIGIESLEVFENIAYIMAKHADSNFPDNPDDFLEQFNTFSIYEILPQLIELWVLNTATQIESKKTSPDWLPDDNSAFPPEMQTARSFYDRAGFAYYWTYQ